MNESHTYALTDPTALAAKIEAVGGPRLDPTKPTGEATADGVTLGWSIAADEITITIIHTPWYIKDDVVWSHVNKLLGDPL